MDICALIIVYVHSYYIIYNNNYNSNPLHIISRQENIKILSNTQNVSPPPFPLWLSSKTFTFDCRSFPHLLFLSGKIAIDLRLHSRFYLFLSPVSNSWLAIHSLNLVNPRLLAPVLLKLARMSRMNYSQPSGAGSLGCRMRDSALIWNMTLH